MFLFKSKKPIEPKKEAEQVNVDLELVTKMNQDFALSLDLNDTLMNAFIRVSFKSRDKAKS